MKTKRFFDRAASIAARKGHAPEVFSRAAQKHADAFWWWLLSSGIVWYFIGWKWSLITAVFAVYAAFNSISSSAVSIRLETKRQEYDEAILADYGEALQRSGFAIRDVGDLPCSKQEIIDAAVRAIGRHPELSEQIKTAAMMLAYFQDGVGNTPIPVGGLLLQDGGIDTEPEDIGADPRWDEVRASVERDTAAIEKRFGSNTQAHGTKPPPK